MKKLGFSDSRTRKIISYIRFVLESRVMALMVMSFYQRAVWGRVTTPFSPYLFLIYVDGFSSLLLILKLIERQSVKICRNAPYIYIYLTCWLLMIVLFSWKLTGLMKQFQEDSYSLWESVGTNHYKKKNCILRRFLVHLAVVQTAAKCFVWWWKSVTNACVGKHLAAFFFSTAWITTHK